MKACCVGFVRGRSQLPLVSVIFAISAASLASTPSSMSFLLKATYWRLGLGFGPTPKAKPWKGEGSGVLEILEGHRGDTFLSPFNSPEPNRKTRSKPSPSLMPSQACRESEDDHAIVLTA